MALVVPSTRSTGDIITASIWNQDVVDNVIALLPCALEFLIDGGGTIVTTGMKGALSVPAKCDITSVELLADQTGSIVVDLWKDTYANWIPTDADSITASTPPTISASNKSVDTTLSSWTTAITAGDKIVPNVDSCSTITWCLLSINVSKS